MWFKRRKQPPSDNQLWLGVTAKLAGTLMHLIQHDPRMLAAPYARIVLTDRWDVGVATDKREPEDVLRPGQVAFVFLRENPDALGRWIDELKAPLMAAAAEHATQHYAATLVRTLRGRVIVDD